MKLFETLNDLMDNGASVKISIFKKEDQLTVGILPVSNLKDEAFKNLPMMTVTGTVKELDEQWLDAIKEPIEKTNALFNNVKNYEKDLEKIEANTALKKEEEKKVEKIMTKVGEVEKKDAKNYQEMKKILAKGLKDHPDNKRLKSKLDEINKHEPTMFDVPAVEKKEEPKVEPKAPIKESTSEPEVEKESSQPTTTLF